MRIGGKFAYADALLSSQSSQTEGRSSISEAMPQPQTSWVGARGQDLLLRSFKVHPCAPSSQNHITLFLTAAIYLKLIE